MLLGVVLGFSFPTKAQVTEYGMSHTNIPKGLPVGSVVKNLVFTNQLNEEISLNVALEEGPVVITFYRGNWCPYCSRALAALSDSISFITDAGATLIAISPESKDQLLLTSEEVTLGINLVADNSGELMRFFDVDFDVTTEYQEKLDRLGLPDLKEHNNQEHSVLPVPAVYVLDQKGKIVWRYFNYDYHERASIQSILKAIKQAR